MKKLTLVLLAGALCTACSKSPKELAENAVKEYATSKSEIPVEITFNEFKETQLLFSQTSASSGLKDELSKRQNETKRCFDRFTTASEKYLDEVGKVLASGNLDKSPTSPVDSSAFYQSREKEIEDEIATKDKSPTNEKGYKVSATLKADAINLAVDYYLDLSYKVVSADVK